MGLDINTGHNAGGPKQSKFEIQDQQREQFANNKRSRNFWHTIEYPGKYILEQPFQISLAVIILIAAVVFLFRIFGVPDYEKSLIDLIIGYTVAISFAFASLATVCIVIFNAWQYFYKKGIYTLPNGFPVSFKTIHNNYDGLNESVLAKLGYFDVENARAGNPIVAPGEINTTYAPETSTTYAPSINGTQNESANDTKLLEHMLDSKPQSIVSSLPESVDLFEMVEQRDAGHIVLGVNEDGDVVQVPIDNSFHMLVGGTSGWGKSVFLRSMVYMLMREAEDTSTSLVLGLADIENNTFPEFKDTKYVKWYAADYVSIEHMTHALLKEVERRKVLYEQMGNGIAKNLSRYNELAHRNGLEELPMVVVFYDEFSALMHRAAQQKRILSDILQLALRSRKYGIFLVIAGQTFKADLIDSSVTGQFSFNIAFKTRNNTASMQIIGQPGAESLTQPGEAFIKTKDGTVYKLQTPYVDEDALLDAIEEFRTDSKANIVPDVVREIISYSKAVLENKVKFKEIEKYMKENFDMSRSDTYSALRWMDDNGFSKRNDRNGRELNWPKIKEYLPDEEIQEE